ncbi:MAG: hypothetical protein OJF52_003818 [Nitrospira sp.]|nr:MAG: hypothetical protein OJF52_003818 [Nitrospira sp.]
MRVRLPRRCSRCDNVTDDPRIGCDWCSWEVPCAGVWFM